MSLDDLDRAHLIHPLTEFRAHEAQGATVVTGGEGIRIRTADGRELIDGLSGLWNIVVGHSRREIGDAVQKQMSELAYYPGVWEFASEPVIRLAERLSHRLPSDRQLQHFLFTTGGSEAIELALRFAYHYHALRGEPGRLKVLARSFAYHGITQGAGSATRMGVYHEQTKPADAAFVEIPPHYPFRNPLCQGPDGCTLRCADAIEEVIEREGASSIAALIAEPVMATGGVHPPPPGYWPRLREICDRHGILLVADEIVTGFGRTGSWFGMETVDGRPDLVCLAKGITSGYLPLGAVGLSTPVYETIRDRAPQGARFMGALTAGNHPACCAAAHANLDILEREGLVENAATVGAHLNAGLRERFGAHELVGDVRGIGMMAAIECAAPGTTEPAGHGPGEFPVRVSRKARERGLIVRPGQENLMLAPPLCTTPQEVDEILAILSDAFEAAVAEG